MRAAKTESTDQQGISGVMGAFQSLGWGPIENPKHDLGTDIYVQVRDDRRFDRGLFVGVQVKTGSSYFRSPEPATDREGMLGWWFSEGRADHFDYWIGHAIPHLLVLHDLDVGMSYWVQVTAEAVLSTGRGNKILVPSGQTIDGAHVEELLGIASTLKQAPPLEGQAWTMAADALAPGQRYRFALLAPRLVRPRSMSGAEEPISSIEAVGLLLDGRARDLASRAEAPNSSIPHPAAAHVSGDWGWRFVSALWAWLADHDPSRLEAAVRTAPDSPRRTAAAICRACSLADAGELPSAVVLLDGEIADDEANPIDWAWLRVQRGRFRAEVGDMEAARHDALEAKRALIGDPDDITSSAIGAAASTLLWQTLEWPSDGLADVARANDTAISWWRALAVSAALEEGSNRAFSTWSDDQSVHFMLEDRLMNGLLAACRGAHLAGDHTKWRSLLRLLGRHQLMAAHTQADNDLMAAGFDNLRLSGDTQGVGKAARHLRRVGPLGGLKSALERIDEHSWTHTSAGANLKAWDIAGDLLDNDHASRSVRFCIESLEAGESARLARLGPRFDLPHMTLNAIRGLLAAADDEANQAFVGFVASLPNEAGNDATDLERALRSVRADSLEEAERRSLQTFAERTPSPDLAATALGLLLEAGDNEATAMLLERVQEGDLVALASLPDLRVVDEHYIPAFMDILEPTVISTTTKARSGEWVTRTTDAAHTLTVLNITFPASARWDALLDLLAEPSVLPGDKVRTCRALIQHASDLDDATKEQLIQRLDALAATRPPVVPLLAGGITSTAGVAEALAMALGVGDNQAVTLRTARLALAGWEERRDLARLLANGGPPTLTGALLTLAGDAHPDVRAEAGAAAAKRIVNGTAELIEHAVVDQLLATDGVLNAMAVLRGLGSTPRPIAEVPARWISHLSQHPSAIVRLSTETVRHHLRG